LRREKKNAESGDGRTPERERTSEASDSYARRERARPVGSGEKKIKNTLQGNGALHIPGNAGSHNKRINRGIDKSKITLSNSIGQVDGGESSFEGGEREK